MGKLVWSNQALLGECLVCARKSRKAACATFLSWDGGICSAMGRQFLLPVTRLYCPVSPVISGSSVGILVNKRNKEHVPVYINRVGEVRL